MKPLPRRFYARDCLLVAPDLIGCHLVHRTKLGLRRGRIVEVEAYVHEEDQACHARFGKTPRSLLLYGQPGHAYVFLIYGMYDQFNVVCEPEGSPAAILIRALEPEPPLTGGTDGPGKLCRALGITRAHNGLDLVGGDTIWLEPRTGPAPRIVTTPRIGIDYAGEWAQKPWRFVDADSTFLSRRLQPAAGKAAVSSKAKRKAPKAKPAAKAKAVPKAPTKATPKATIDRKKT